MTMPEPTDSPLPRLLASLRISATRLMLCRGRAPWGLRVGSLAPASLYVVMDGGCSFEVDGKAPVRLEAGDAVLLTRPLGYAIYSEAGADLTPIADVRMKHGWASWADDKSGDHLVQFDHGGDGALTSVACMSFEIAGGWGSVFLAGLPAVIRVVNAEANVKRWVDAFIAALAGPDEACAAQGAVILRLAEILFLSTLGAHLGSDRGAQGWCRVLLDPALSRVVAAVQRAPGEKWTVERLARSVNLSRSTFALRFKQMAGCSPYEFLEELRMRLAIELLTTTDMSGKEVSRAVGYSSDSVFGAAFRRKHGVAPGQYAKAMLAERTERSLAPPVGVK